MLLREQPPESPPAEAVKATLATVPSENVPDDRVATHANNVVALHHVSMQVVEVSGITITEFPWFDVVSVVGELKVAIETFLSKRGGITTPLIRSALYESLGMYLRCCK